MSLENESTLPTAVLVIVRIQLGLESRMISRRNKRDELGVVRAISE